MQVLKYTPDQLNPVGEVKGRLGTWGGVSQATLLTNSSQVRGNS